MERECNKCVFHTSGACSKWRCPGTTTVEEVKAEARREVLQEVINEIYRNSYNIRKESSGDSTIEISKFKLETLIKNLEEE